MLAIALMIMIGATIAQHLGLGEAVARVAHKIARCPKCISFWSVLVILVILNVHPIVALGLSLLCSYLSNWMGLLLMLLANIYNELWEKVNKER